MPAFANRVALITGAASGLGKQLALILAEEGAAIAAVDLHEESLIRLGAELTARNPSVRYAWAVADVTDRPGLLKAAASLEERLGPIDLLIANAGIGIETTAQAFRSADIESQVRVNLIGVANSVEAVLPGMLARKQGHLVAISSLASFRGLPRMAGYCAAKAGVNALFDSLRVELSMWNIAVTTICPGWIRTPLTADIHVPMPGLMEADEAARRIVTAIRRRQRLCAFPFLLSWRIRILRSLPCALADWLVYRLSRMMQG